MSSYARAQEIIAKLGAVGVRATMDAAAVNPPCVVVVPPSRRYDLGCGYTARWELAALAPSASGTPSRTSWQALDDLADKVAEVVTITDADLVAYTIGGQTFPAFLLTFEEAAP